MSDLNIPDELIILERLRTLLEETVIEGADNGFGGTFFNTIQDCVYVGRPVFDDNDPVPLISILEVPLPDKQIKPPSRSGLGNLAGPWDLVVQGWAKNDRDPEDRIYNRETYCLRQDVHCALAQERRKLDRAINREPLFGIPRIKDFYWERGVVRPDDERSDTSFFWFPLTIELG